MQVDRDVKSADCAQHEDEQEQPTYNVRPQRKSALEAPLRWSGAIKGHTKVSALQPLAEDAAAAQQPSLEEILAGGQQKCTSVQGGAPEDVKVKGAVKGEKSLRRRASQRNGGEHVGDGAVAADAGKGSEHMDGDDTCEEHTAMQVTGDANPYATGEVA
jgi:hypothetical protein